MQEESTNSDSNIWMADIIDYITKKGDCSMEQTRPIFRYLSKSINLYDYYDHNCTICNINTVTANT